MPTALGEYLVLDVDARHAHLDQSLRNGGGVDGITAARIDVRHHRDAHRADNVAGDVHNVFHIHQADVGLRQQAPGDAETTNLHGLEPGAFDNPGAQRVVAPGHHQRSSAL